MKIRIIAARNAKARPNKELQRLDVNAITPVVPNEI
jgi:hypothetical protein